MKTTERNPMRVGSASLFAFTVFLVMALVGCGGGGGSDTGDTAPVVEQKPLEGVFVDSPVEGLRYETATQTGHTDSRGAFNYMNGEHISFYMGDVMLGSALASEYMTPVHLVEGAVDETDSTVTNMARFMQSLDTDGNPDNGITINQQIHDEMTGRQIDFHQSMTDFENHPDVTGMFDTLNAMGAFAHGDQHLISAKQAQQHLGAHMPGNGSGPGSDTGGMTNNDGNDMPGGDTGGMPNNGGDDMPDGDTGGVPNNGGDDMPDGMGPVMTGIFVDSPVAGLHYETDTQSGDTNAEGMFYYMAGESVTFSIGDVMLGNAPGQGYMTPIDLVEGAVDGTHPTVTNMARFMQSLDYDGNPDNGITITSQLRDQMSGWHIDFHQSMTDFENHPDVTGMFNDFSNMGFFSDGSHMLVSAEDAWEHMREHMNVNWDGQPDDDDGHQPMDGQQGGMGPGNMPGNP